MMGISLHQEVVREVPQLCSTTPITVHFPISTSYPQNQRSSQSNFFHFFTLLVNPSQSQIHNMANQPPPMINNVVNIPHFQCVFQCRLGTNSNLHVIQYEIAYTRIVSLLISIWRFLQPLCNNKKMHSCDIPITHHLLTVMRSNF